MMPKAHYVSYNLAFKLKTVVEAEAVVDNSEIAIDEAHFLFFHQREILFYLNTWLEADPFCS